ncbi:MAG: type III-B CRISPR module-associated protein Cmr5 [Thiotrichales bacterium]
MSTSSIGAIDRLDRTRQQHAFKAVRRWAEGKSDLKDIVTELKGLPVQLRTQGLVHTWATQLKGEQKKRASLAVDLLENITDWLCDKDNVAVAGVIGAELDARGLLARAIEMDNFHYRIVQREALAYAGVLKLLSEAWEKGDG